MVPVVVGEVPASGVGDFGNGGAGGLLVDDGGRAKVYAGRDPLTGREIRFRKTCKSELAAQKELGPAHLAAR